MAKTVNINIRVDQDLKQEAEDIYAELGMNLSTAINVFLHASVRAHGLPFNLRLEEAEEELRIRPMRAHSNGLSRVFDGVDSLAEDNIL